MTKKRREKRRDSEIWKRFLKEILSQLPDLIKKYPRSDQIHLNDFYTVLKRYSVDTKPDRVVVHSNFEKYIQKHQNSEDYLRLPFLWFSRRYFSNANLLLSVEGLYAAQFYGYLVQHLRGNSKTLGAFQLIRNITPLSDLAWEKLQYEAFKLRAPLTREQLIILETIYSFNMEEGIQALNPNRLRAMISKRIRLKKQSKYLLNFFTIIEAQWAFRFFPQAIGLKQLYFHIQLDESTKLKEIIDFNDPNNGILATSQVYMTKGFHNTYTGIITVPDQVMEKIKTYLQDWERKGRVIIHELTEIIGSRISCSITRYFPEEGWRALSQSDLNDLLQKLQTKHPRKSSVSPDLYFMTNSFNPNWNYLFHTTPSEIIKLYCKFFPRFFYKTPFLSANKRQESQYLSKAELKLLKLLFKRGVLNLAFSPNRLINEFSLDFYWIKIPPISSEQLTRLLPFLPYAHIIFTQSNNFMWAYLTARLAKWFNEKLDWMTIPIQLGHIRLNPEISWYDSNKNQWKPPLILGTGN
ncbi:MAG: hypothetical protein ACFE95_00225 [Candidatus Hodarchaeota archaeon]